MCLCVRKCALPILAEIEQEKCAYLSFIFRMRMLRYVKVHGRSRQMPKCFWLENLEEVRRTNYVRKWRKRTRERNKKKESIVGECIRPLIEVDYIVNI